MIAERLYQELKELSERLGIEVSEQNFRATGVKARSGYCVVKGTPMFLIDKKKRLQRRIQILSEFLSGRITEDVFMVPAVREHLEKFRMKQQGANLQPELFAPLTDKDQ
jgi:hypothetical protein